MKTSSLLTAAASVAPALAQYETEKPLVSSKALEHLVKLEDLLAGSQKLQDFADANGGNRAFGGGGHLATTDWLFDELQATGYYDVYKQPFTQLFSAATVNLTAGGSAYPASYMTYGPSSNGTITKPLVAVRNVGCDAADYPAGVAGNIALISRGICPFGQKAANAKTAGAAGAIIYNNIDGALAGTLGAVGDYAPVVGVSGETGRALVAAVGNNSALEGSLFVNAIQENRTNYNVIAETKGGDHNNVLALGGHSDSVFAGPGVNDDGSGTIGVLQVAKYLTHFSVTNAVRFAFWGAEEFGLLGSYHYLRTINGTLSGGPAELAKVRAYLNFDMIASPNYVLGIYDGDGSAFNFSGPTGSDTIERDFEHFYEAKGLPHVPSLFSFRSDYAAFLRNGIPAGGIFTGAEELKTPEEAQLFGGTAGVALDENYHKPGDTIDNLAHDAYLLNTQAIASLVAKYALQFEGIPRPNGTLRRRDSERADVLADLAAAKAHGHSHVAPCGQGTVTV